MNDETDPSLRPGYGANGVYLGKRANASDPESDPDKHYVGDRGWRLDLQTYQLIHDGEGLMTVDTADPSVLLKSVLLEFGDTTDEVVIVTQPRATWFEISKHLRAAPEFRYVFPAEPTAVEEFLAGVYTVDGWDAVTLTPRSGDGGRDVIAVTTGLASVRVLDQAKAYGKDHVVPANDVRALYGVLTIDRNASKGVVTTTSDFAPKVASEFEEMIPYRLELRNGDALVEWAKAQTPGDR